MHPSRPSSQGILGQVASDLANRANSDEMADIQKTVRAKFIFEP